MLDNKAITVLSSGIVVDKAKLAALPAAEMGTLMAAAYSTKKLVVFVDSVAQFLSPRNLIKMLEDGDGHWPIVAEHLKVSLTASDLGIIQQAIVLRKAILDSLKSSYVFAAVPKGWTIEANLQFVGIQVRRSPNANGGFGNGHRYYIGIKTLERVWKLASKRWSGDKSGSKSTRVVADGNDRMAVVDDESIVIGCQTIQRFELEQLAVFKGWEMPQ